VGGAVLTFLKSAVAGVVLSAVYAFANYHNPIVYLNVLLNWGFGCVLGWLIARDIYRFHVRNVFAAGLIAFAVCVVSYVTHWLFYTATVIVDLKSYDVTEIVKVVFLLLENPEAWWGVILGLNEGGVWSLGRLGSSGGGLVMKGPLLTVIWAAEALVLCWFSIKRSVEQAGAPYSERGQDWIPPKELPKPAPFVEDIEGFKNAAARGDCSALTQPSEVWKEFSHAAVTLYADPFEPYVSVKNVSNSIKEPKKSGVIPQIFRWLSGSSDKEASFRCVVRYLKISPATAREIENSLGSL
jgi:hypothetical protein